MSFDERIKEAAANWKPPTSEEWFERTRCRCHKCKRVMEDGEPVWRIRVGYLGFSFMGLPKTKYSVAYFCRQCGPQEAHSDVACEFCNRPIHDTVIRPSGLLLRHYYCSDHCRRLGESAPQTAIISKRRADERGPSRHCLTCEEPFEPTRKHAEYCSGRCRQLAYRRKRAVTDLKSVVVLDFSKA